jgi:ATP-dependent RNA helicase DOB1
MATLEERLRTSPLAADPQLEARVAAYERKTQLSAEAKVLKKAIKQATAVAQMDELKSRKRVLRRSVPPIRTHPHAPHTHPTDVDMGGLHDGRLGYTTAQDVIELKGRVACEISTGDELLLTELIFSGAFNPLSVEQTAALLSCFVSEEKVRPLTHTDASSRRGRF